MRFCGSGRAGHDGRQKMPVVRTATTKTPSKSASRLSTTRRITDIGGSTLIPEMYASAAGCLHRFLNSIPIAASCQLAARQAGSLPLRPEKLANADQPLHILIERQPIYCRIALTGDTVHQGAMGGQMLQELE